MQCSNMWCKRMHVILFKHICDNIDVLLESRLVPYPVSIMLMIATLHVVDVIKLPHLKERVPQTFP